MRSGTAWLPSPPTAIPGHRRTKSCRTEAAPAVTCGFWPSAQIPRAVKPDLRRCSQFRYIRSQYESQPSAGTTAINGDPVGAYRRQILGLLLLRPDETFYVREIARLTGVPAGSLHRELKLLNEAGLLLRATAGNQVRYQAN